MSASAPGSIPLMEKSGQTDAERRLLRQQQRDLQKRIQSNAEAMEDPSLHVFSEIREENNALFAKVAYTREAVLDGESVQMISKHAAKHGREDAVPRYNAIRVSQKLVTKFKRLDKFDWHSFGVQAGTCFDAIPSRVQFLRGSLHTDFIPRKARAKRKRVEYVDDEPEERPDVITNLQENADASHSAVEGHIRVLRKVLKQRSEQVMYQVEKSPDKKRLKHGDYEVDAIQYMFNPHSFTQTVENIFHFSFLVKSGNAKICARPNGPKVASISRSITDEPRQAIVAITPRDWRDLCRAHKVTQSDIPHRTVPLQVRLARTPPAVNLETTRTTSAETNREESVETSYPSSNLKASAFRSEECAATIRDNNTTGPDGTHNRPGDYLVEETNPPGYPNDVSSQAASPGGDASDSNGFAIFPGGHGENTDYVDVCTPTGSPTKSAPTGSPVVVTPESTQEPTTTSRTFFLSESCVNNTNDFDTLAAHDSPVMGSEFVEDDYFPASGGLFDLSGETNNVESLKERNGDGSGETNDKEPADNSNPETTDNAESVATSNEESSGSKEIHRHSIIIAEKWPEISGVYLAFWTSVCVWALGWNFLLQLFLTSPTFGSFLSPTGIWISIASVLMFFVSRVNILLQLLWPSAGDVNSADVKRKQVDRLEATSIVSAVRDPPKYEVGMSNG
jgi:hypothetical protein